MIVEENVLKSLEYLLVLDRLGSGCRTQAGGEFLRALRPLGDAGSISLRQARTESLEKLNALQGNLPIPETLPLAALVAATARDGTILKGEELADLAALLGDLADLQKQLDRLDREKGVSDTQKTVVKDWHFQLAIEQALRDRLARTVSSTGQVLDDATPELAQARHRVRRHRDEVKSFYRDLLADPDAQEALQDKVVTERDGRLVVPVKRERQSRVPGLLHGLSTSGSTAFIEPSGAVEGNNKLREALLMEEAETARALAEATRAVLVHREALDRAFRAVAEVDAHGALARFTADYDGAAILPERGAVPALRQARHPLLSLQAGKDFRDKVVPLDLAFDASVRGVLVSGPNAGGKTAALKTLGLTCLMAQAGMPVLATGLTVLPFLSRMDSDLPDEQDLENHLSTFAAKLTALKRMMESAAPGGLVLLDELGSGTDPREGGALGLAVLEKLTASGALVFASTHQPELKRLAVEAPGLANAAMVYDEATGKPTYRLVQGLPGQSHALGLAKEVGFPPDVLERAQGLLPAGEADLSALLEKASQEKLLAEAARREAETARSDAQKLRADLAEARKKSKDEAKEIRDLARQEASGLVKNARRQVEHLVQGLGAAPLAGRDPGKFKEARKALNEKLKHLEIPAGQRPQASMSLAPGDPVVVKSSGLRGRLEAADDGKAQATVRLEGGMKVTCDYGELEAVAEKAEPHKVFVRGPQASGSGKLEVDVRGCRLDEAIRIVDKFLDDALVAGQPFARILHGKGTGQLRKGLHEHLKDHPAGYEFRIGEWGEGDFGVTIVDINR